MLQDKIEKQTESDATYLPGCSQWRIRSDKHCLKLERCININKVWNCVVPYVCLFHLFNQTMKKKKKSVHEDLSLLSKISSQKLRSAPLSKCGCFNYLRGAIAADSPCIITIYSSYIL